MKLVPEVPTEAMIDAGCEIFNGAISERFIAQIYTAMLSAAPAADGEVVYQVAVITFQDGAAAWVDCSFKEYTDTKKKRRILYTTPQASVVDESMTGLGLAKKVLEYVFFHNDQLTGEQVRESIKTLFGNEIAEALKAALEQSK